MEEENEKKIDEEVKKLFPDADDGFTGIDSRAYIGFK